MSYLFIALFLCGSTVQCYKADRDAEKKQYGWSFVAWALDDVFYGWRCDKYLGAIVFPSPPYK